METILAAALGAFGLIGVALIGLYGARKIGIGKNQEVLVATLKDLIEAQNQKIKILEEQRNQDRKRIEALEHKVEELTHLTVYQALEIDRLRHPYEHSSRNIVTPEGGE
jgi:Tfp pilus assembly protein PilN